MRGYLVFLVILIFSCSRSDSDMLKADQLLQNGRFHEAISIYDSILIASPEKFAAITGRARAYKELGEYDKAYEDIERVLKVDQTNSDNLVLRGFLLARKGKIDSAKTDYFDAIAIDSNAYAFNNLASIHMDNGSFDTALTYCNLAINRNKDPIFYNNRGYLYELMEQSRNAILDYDIAIMLDSIQPFYYYNRSISRYHVNDIQGCIDDLSNAIRILPEFKECYYYRGIAYHDLGCHDLAYNDLIKAEELGVPYARKKITEWYSSI